MSEIVNISTVNEYNQLIGTETLHPLVSIVDFQKAEPFCYFRGQMGVYCIFLKDIKCGNITYGINDYDYEKGTLIFVSPGQVYGVASQEKQRGFGRALIFHPDLIHGTALGKNIKEYSFFSYEVNEAFYQLVKEL